MLYTGVDGLSVNENNIKFKTQYGQLEESIPYSYIKESGKEVKATYKNTGDCVLFSAAKEYNETLIIDPMVVWSTYYGGNGDEINPVIATNNNGDVYIVSQTTSTNNIATSGAHLSTVSSGNFGMLVKFNSSGVRQWGTYYGSGGIQGMGICIDINNNVIITGSTYDKSGIATTGAHQTTNLGPTNKTDAFVAKFDSNGKRKWGTFYGGNTGADGGAGLTSDEYGNIIMIGTSGSTSGIATTGSHQTSNGGNYDVFIVKFDSSGVRQWATFLGGNGNDYGFEVATDNNNNIYACGTTVSSNNISTTSSHQSSFGGGASDAFLVKFDSTGKRIWGTYFGGSSFDYGSSIHSSNDGYVYTTGYTGSSSGIATSGSHQTSLNTGYSDAFIAKFDTTGVLKMATYFGGKSEDNSTSIRTDSNNIYIAGYTYSTQGLATKGVHQDTLAGKEDAFLAKFTKNGKLLWSTYFGGTGPDRSYSIAVYNGCSIYVSGQTGSDNGIAATGAHQTTRTAYYDAFIAKFPTFGVAFTGTSSLCVGTSAVYKTVKETGSTYTWKVSGGKITAEKSSSDSITVQWDKAGKGTVKLIVSPASGCYDSVTKTVTVHALPAAYTGLGTSICYGNQVSIGGKAVTGNSYSWRSVPEGFTSTLANPTDKPLVTTKYYLTETVVATGCSKTDSVTVHVIPLPVVDINGANAYCEKGKTIYTTKAESGSTLRWAVTGGTILSGHGTESIVVVWNKWGEGEIKLIETTINGCIDSNKVKIKVYALPKADFTGTRVCHGDTTIFKNYSNNSAIFHWNFGDSSTSTQTHPRHVYSAPGVYNVALSVTSYDGCVDTFRTLITVDSMPAASFITENNICLGKELTFTNTSTTGDIYNWQFGDNSTSSLKQPKYVYKDTGTYTVTLNVKSVNGCTSSTIQKVRVNAMPKADFTFSDACLGEEVKFMNQSIFGDTYIWNFGDNNTATTTIAYHLYKVAGTYKVQLKVLSKSGCTDSITKTVRVFTRPDAAFTVTKDKEKRTFTFTATNTSYNKYLWQFGDGKTDTTNSVKHTYKNDSTYKISLRITDNNGCTDTKDTTIIVTTVGVQENVNDELNKIQVYPNPFNNQTVIECSLTKASNVSITLYDISGRSQILIPLKLLPTGNHQFLLDAAEYKLGAGIYLIKLDIDGTSVTRRILKIE